MLQENNNQANNANVPDVFEVLRVLLRYKKLMAQIMVGCMAVGFIIIMLLPNYYKAYATIVLNEQSLNVSDFQNIFSGVKQDNMSVQTELKILNSHSLALATVQKSELLKHPEYAGIEREEEAISAFAKNLSVNSQGVSRAIEIIFKSKDPEFAAKVANIHANSYLESQVEFKRQQAEKMRGWFEVKVKELKADAIKKAQAVQDYRAKEKLVIGKDKNELIYQQISDVAGQLVPVEVSKYGMQAKSQDADKTDSDDIIKSPLIQNLKTQASNISQELGSLRAKYGPNHPRVLEIKNRLTQVNAAIASETAAIEGAVIKTQAATETQETLLKSRLDTLNQEADNLRDKMITLESLQIEADASKKILDNFLKNYETIQSQVSFAWPDATLVSPAVTPTKPAPPGKKLLMFFVTILSASLALTVVFMKELMQRGVRSFDDVRQLQQIPLGILPFAADIATAMHSTDASSYREAVKRVYMSGLMNSKARTLLVTSAMPKEGRSTLAQSMANYLVSLGHNVVLVDADFLRPTLTKNSGLRKAIGFTDVLLGCATLDDAISTDEDVRFLPAGSQLPASPDMLQELKLQRVLAQLRAAYEFVLIDSGPLMAHSEAAAIARASDAVLVVAEWLKTPQKSLSNLFVTLKELDAEVLGVVINKVDIGKYKTISTSSDFLLPKAANAA
ncbi:MAG: GumC family protein [Alphaproteobacteria bacterium]